MSEDEKLTILDKHVSELSEIFDAAQILVTWLNPDGVTKSFKRGSGNWYARQGLAQDFINEDFNHDQARAIAKELEPPDDDNWKEGVGTP